MICPNISSQEWKNLVAEYGEDGAYKKWLENGKEIPGIVNMTMGQVGSLVKDLQKNIDMDVVMNPDMEVSGRVIKVNGDHRIEINPNLLQNDTIIHEFGHVYIDLLGGLSNPIIKAGIARLRGSELEKEIKRKYPDLSNEAFDKELLATAVGLEGEKIWKRSPKKASLISKWITAFYKNLNKLIGIKPNIAKELAKDLLQDRVAKESLTGNIEAELYEQRASDSSKDTASARQKKLAEDALGVISSKVEILKRNLDQDNKGQAAVLAELVSLRKKLKKNRAEKSIADFVIVAEKQTNKVLEKFREYEKEGNEVSLRTMKYLKDSMLAFDPGLLQAISEDLTPEQSDIQAELDKIAINQDKADRLFRKIGNKLVMQEINPKFEKIEAIYRRKAEMEFLKKNREKDSKEKKEKKEEYIAEFLEEFAEEIEQKKKERMDTFLTYIEKDISTIDSFINNPKDMNSDIIREATHMIDKADFEIQKESVFIARQAESLNKAYTEYVGKFNDQKKQWEPILSKGENGEVLPELARKGSPTWSEIKNNGGKYKGTPVEEMYDFLIETSKETDKRVPPKFRLDGSLPSLNKNSFERVAENGLLTALREGTIDQFKLRKEDVDSGQELTDDEKDNEVRSSLDDSVKVLSTQAGEERKVIPINYRGKMEESDRSYDVLSLMVLDAHQSIQYEKKHRIANTLEVMLELVNTAKIEQRSGLAGRLKKNLDGAKQLKEGDSNTYRALESVIESRIYNIKTTGDPTLAKISSKVKSYVSIINLFGNYLSAGANFTQGNAMIFMEGAGSQFYSVKDVMTAANKYRKDLGSTIADSSRQRDKGLTNLLREHYNAVSDWNVLEHEFSKNDAIKRNANLGAGLVFNKVAEHSAQSIGMYSVLNNIKVKDKDGSYITKSGEKTEDRSKAMSIDEAYESGAQNIKTKKTISREAYVALTESQKKGYIDGVLHLNELVTSTDRTEGVGNFEISQILRRVNRDLFGSYDPNNKSIIERHAIGALFTHMRGWMIPGVKKRWKGGHSLFIKDKKAALKFRTIKSDELRDVDLDFNRETNEFEEGMYISTMRFVGSIAQEANKLKFQVISENWKDLTDLEKRNIQRTASELAMMAAAYISYVVLEAAMDDEDDLMATLAAFYSRRLLSELMTYTHPFEWVRTFRSPAVTLSLIENVLKAIHQTASSPTEEYERGRNKGKNKAVQAWMKLTPLKILDKDVEASLKYLQKGY